MRREEFIEKRWTAFELIEYRSPRKNDTDFVVECMLIAIDFENELFKLEPIDKEIYEDNQFWARVEYCKRPHPKLKKV